MASRALVYKNLQFVEIKRVLKTYYCKFEIKTTSMKAFGTLFLFLLFLSTSVMAQEEDNNWSSRDYQIEDFSSIYLHGGYKVFLQQGNKPALTVKTSNADVFDHLKVENRGDELSLVMKEDFITYKRIRLYITFTDLEEIKVEGGLKLDSDGYLDLDDLLLSVEGGASVDLQIKAKDVKLVGQGGILVDLEGVANSLTLKLSGAGHVDADELKTQDANIDIEGVGTASVYATDRLHAKIEGVGKVSYKGNPRVTEDIEGLGAVRRQ